MRKIKVQIGRMIRYCSRVRMHALYESNVGVIRKLIQPGMIFPPEKVVKLSWWKRLKLFIKKILKWEK